MKILAIDQSYTNSGIVVLDENEIKHASLFKSTAAMDKPGRAWQIATHIGTLVEKYQPDIVAMEGLAFGMRGDATRDLAGLQFVLACILRHEHQKEVMIVSPKTAKVVATGSGSADKMEMVGRLPKYARDLFEGMNAKKTTGLTDLSDAYWIAKTVSNPEFKSQGFDKPKKKRVVKRKK